MNTDKNKLRNKESEKSKTTREKYAMAQKFEKCR